MILVVSRWINNPGLNTYISAIRPSPVLFYTERENSSTLSSISCNMLAVSWPFPQQDIGHVRHRKHRGILTTQTRTPQSRVTTNCRVDNALKGTKVIFSRWRDFVISVIFQVHAKQISLISVLLLWYGECNSIQAYILWCLYLYITAIISKYWISSYQ